MKIELDSISPDTYRINAYAAGSLTVSGQTYESGIILARNTIIEEWEPGKISEFGIPEIEPIISLQPEIVILGTGARLEFPPAEITGFFHARSVGLEVMDTGAACRAFNFMVADDRNVVAALLII